MSPTAWKPPDADRQAAGWAPPAADRVQQPEDHPSALSRLGSAFWDGIGGKAVADIMAGASRNPDAAKKAIDTAKGLVNGIVNEPARVWHELGETGNAMVHGDIAGTASHLGQSVPLVGAGAGQVQHDFENGKYAEGFGHALALLLPFAAKGTGATGAIARTADAALERAAPALEAAPGALKDGVKAAPTAIAGAVKGAARGAVEPVSYGHLRLPVPASVAGAGAGGYVAGQVGLPHAAGAIAGAAMPIVRGAIKGAKSALAERLAAAVEKMPGPEGFGVAEGSTVAPPKSSGAGPAAPARPASAYQPPVAGSLPGQVFAGAVEEAGTPGQALARDQGLSTAEWAKLEPQERAVFEQAARAQQNAPEPSPRPLVGPRQFADGHVPVAGLPENWQNAPEPSPLAGKTVADLIAEEFARPAAAKAAKNGPLRPPLAEATPPPPEVAGVPPAAAPRAPVRPPLRTPETAPAAGEVPPAEPATPKKRSLAQIEADMVRKKPAEIDPNAARSEFDANGERKSRLLRGAEVKAWNVDQKAQRFAQAFHAEGITPEDVSNMTKADAEIMTNGLIAKGILKPDELPPNQSIPLIKKHLTRLWKKNPNPQPAPTVGSYLNPKARAIAEQLAAEMAK